MICDKALIALIIALNLIPAFAQNRIRQVQEDIPLGSIQLSDPSILADKNTSTYYMTGSGGLLWKSKDLKRWSGPYNVTKTDPNSWMGPRPMIWEAELHAHKGKYYYFATFTNRNIVIETVKGNVINRRASHVLVSDKPDGPYVPMKNPTYLPPNKPTLDGTFWVDKDDKPYLIYCHEWLQYWNGTIIFNKVTDGPYLFRTQTGKLGMIWTSWVFSDYTQGVAYSESGTLDGPWVHEREPITPPNYGHGMLFRTLEGKLLMSVHSHKSDNGRTVRIPCLFEVDDSGDKIIVSKPY